MPNADKDQNGDESALFHTIAAPEVMPQLVPLGPAVARLCLHY